MPEVFASLGSNQDRENNIRSAILALRARFGELRMSPVYQNKASGFEGDDFLNMVVSFDSDEDVFEIQSVFRQIEDDHGRLRNVEKFSPRRLDIDLILYGDMVCSEDRLSLPREDIEKYGFVLLPLVDLKPEGMHPVLSKTYASMWEAYTGDRELTQVDLGQF